MRRPAYGSPKEISGRRRGGLRFYTRSDAVHSSGAAGCLCPMNQLVALHQDGDARIDSQQTNTDPSEHTLAVMHVVGRAHLDEVVYLWLIRRRLTACQCDCCDTRHSGATDNQSLPRSLLENRSPDPRTSDIL